MLHGQTPGTATVNDQMASAASGLPIRSVTPLEPPFTEAVYVAPAARGRPGTSVAVSVDGSYDTVAATAAFEASRSTNVAAEIVAEAMASLNVTVTDAVGATPCAPDAGVNADAVGGVVSGGSESPKTTSTQ